MSPWKGGRLDHIGVSKITTNATADSIIHKLETYYTFLFPRHPLDRLVSAFIDKFMGQERMYAQKKAQEVKEL